MNTTHQLQLVIDFMNIAGQEVNTTPTYQSTGVSDFRTRLIVEELHGPKELVDSINKDNLVGIVDGLADILYVTYGAFATFGITCNEFPIYSRSTGKSKLMYKHDAFYLVRAIDSAVKQYERGLESGDVITIGRGLQGIIYEVNRIAEACNVDLANAFEEVHASNLSKFCTSEMQAINSTTQRILANDDKSEEYKDSHIELRNGVWVILRNSDGKILKGNGFYEPNLEPFA